MDYGLSIVKSVFSWLVATFWVQSFLQNLVSTLIGAALGIPIGIYLHGWIQHRHRTDRRNELVKVLKESVATNRALLETLKTTVGNAKDQNAYFSLDTELLDSTSSVKYEFIDDLELNRSIDSLRHLLKDLNHLIGVHVATASNPTMNLNWLRMNLTQEITRAADAAIEKAEQISNSPTLGGK